MSPSWHKWWRPRLQLPEKTHQSRPSRAKHNINQPSRQTLAPFPGPIALTSRVPGNTPLALVYMTSTGPIFVDEHALGVGMRDSYGEHGEGGGGWSQEASPSVE
ncbi:hypothetical protein CC1G_14948 [Coprinopsis cinerea okayama7|uniref:Uncharacterized protein n=1 Tax=Coprinopsis cinerea (strain Okayama-7 / 130 / ATCC MYA-4618 / FGSC 9003) TaxID=240176 RepID=D6RP11_COPC7|nr:hypothetical protein CC1G_14948 [Coprinopsis cinerea okayama7\|eukprot:XP_002910617.1 hypothetical protein CC1G_14948 [Coprinopsis cinerea okayama7\